MNETNMASLPIRITPHYLTLSPALRDLAHEKLAKVPRFARDVLAADVVLRRHHGTADGKRFSASARLALAGRDIHATAAHANLYTAIVKLVALLARRSRKRNTRLRKTYSPRREAALHETRRSLHQLKTSRFATPELAVSTTRGELRSPRRRDGGQEQRVFVFRRAAPFVAHRRMRKRHRTFSG